MPAQHWLPQHNNVQGMQYLLIRSGNIPQWQCALFWFLLLHMAASSQKSYTSYLWPSHHNPWMLTFFDSNLMAALPFGSAQTPCCNDACAPKKRQLFTLLKPFLFSGTLIVLLVLKIFNPTDHKWNIALVCENMQNRH